MDGGYLRWCGNIWPLTLGEDSLLSDDWTFAPWRRTSVYSLETNNCERGKPRLLCYATAWLAGLRLTGERSMSQRCVERIPVYCRSVRSMEIYPSDIERYLRELRIATNVCKSTTMFFGKVGECILTPRPVQLFGDPIHCIDSSRSLGVNLDKQLIWPNHLDQMR